MRRRSNVRRIIVVRAEGGEPIQLYRKKKKKRKVTKCLRPLEKATRRVVFAASDASDFFARRYRRSRDEKRDGWARDMPSNVMKAQRRFAKRLKLRRFGWP